MTMTKNEEIAHLLEKVGAVFRVKEGDTFRYRAYMNAATTVDNLGEPIDELYKQNKLEGVPGIGEKLRAHIGEYLKNGHVRHFDAQFKKVPAGMFSLMDIRGIGPITAYKIAEKFKLNDADKAVGQLKKLIKEGKLKKIKSFKEKSVEKINKAIKVESGGKGRMLLVDVLPQAEDFIEYLKKSPDIKDAEPLGSLRRRLPTIGDIDLAINAKDPSKAMSYALKYPKVKAVITKGDKVSHVKLTSGYEVDIKISLPDQWGSLLQHYTGSKMHNIKLRTMALKKHLSLSEYGIKHGKKLYKFTDEKTFYKKLGMEYIPPEIREDSGEIEAALHKKIPNLVELKDIKGDLHVHSDFKYPSSHDKGVTSLSDLLEYAENLGYSYLGLADHNPKFTGLSNKQKETILIKRRKYLEDHFRAYEKRVKKSSIKLLIGMEVDIRADGELALNDELMSLLDYAIVSVHTNFNLDSAKNTARIIKALSHPKSVILGHPTGRLINKRNPIKADWKTIFEFCGKNKKVIEVNADPHRLDLPDELIRQASDSKVKFIIDTDSHDVHQFDYMKYGLWQARKGWLTSRQVINTYSYSDLKSMIK